MGRGRERDRVRWSGCYYPRNDTVDTRVSCVPETLANEERCFLVWVYRCARSYVAIPVFSHVYTVRVRDGGS